MWDFRVLIGKRKDLTWGYKKLKEKREIYDVQNSTREQHHRKEKKKRKTKIILGTHTFRNKLLNSNYSTLISSLNAMTNLFF